MNISLFTLSNTFRTLQILETNKVVLHISSMADFKPNIMENRAAFCASNTSVLHRYPGTDMFVWLKLFFLVCLWLCFSSAWHHRSPVTALRQLRPLRCRLSVLTGGLLLPCRDVYICSEGNFQSKNAPKFQQTGRKRRGNGSKQQLLQLDQVHRGFRIPVLGSWSPSRRRGRVLRFPVLSGNAHPSSNQKRSRSFRLDLQDIRWLMEVDGTGSDLWSRNLQRFQRTGLLLVEFSKNKIRISVHTH